MRRGRGAMWLSMGAHLMELLCLEEDDGSSPLLSRELAVRLLWLDVRDVLDCIAPPAVSMEL